MQINYNIDHRLLALPVFEKVESGYTHIAVLITLSCISHFTTHAGNCTFYMSKMSNDWNIDQRFFSKAIKILKKVGYIKCIKPYDAKTQSAAVYTSAPAYYTECKKLLHPVRKPATSSAGINNPKKGLKRDESLFNGDSLSKEETKPTTNYIEHDYSDLFEAFDDEK